MPVLTQTGARPKRKELINKVASNQNVNNLSSLNRTKYDNHKTVVELMRLPIQVGKIKLSALIDTGSCASFISASVFALLKPSDVKQIEHERLNFVSASGERMKTQGRFEIIIKIHTRDPIKHAFFVLPVLKEKLLLGLDFISKNDIIINARKRTFSYTFNKAQREIIMQIDNSPMIKQKKYRTENVELNHLPKEQKSRFLDLLHKYDHIFATSIAELGFTDVIRHRIIDNDQPVYRRPYRIPITQRPILDKMIDELSQAGIIRPSTSPYCSPVLLVKKKTGDLRLTLDFRALNAQTVKSVYPLPLISELFDALYGSSFFSLYDLHSAFYQLAMHPNDMHKTSFVTHNSQWEFTRMPMGISGAPSSYSRLMEIILKPVLRKHTLVYIDDILIYSNSFEEHLKHTEEVFQILLRNGLRLKPGKCSMVKAEILFLGHIIDANGIRPDPKKVEAIKNYPIPKNVDQLRSSLGLLGYYRKFIRNYGEKAHPLTELTKKSNKWDWQNIHTEAFNSLRNDLMTLPILRLPNLEL